MLHNFDKKLRSPDFSYTVSAISTPYKGRFFRPRLEARYAVFFDHLGIRWQYEPEGFEMSDGALYLPDFWIEQGEYFAEVKPVYEAFDQRQRRFCMESEFKLLLLDGEPSMRIYQVLERASDEYVETWPISLDMDHHGTRDEDRFFTFPEELDPVKPLTRQFSQRFQSAVDAALSARFEDR